MTKELQRKVENFTYGMQLTLEAIDQLEQERFYARQIKFHGKALLSEIEKMYASTFSQTTPQAADYYVRLTEWLKVSSHTFEKFNTLSEENKVKYLTALANFNTLNLK